MHNGACLLFIVNVWEKNLKRAKADPKQCEESRKPCA
jgi:hypothetical protein